MPVRSKAKGGEYVYGCKLDLKQDMLDQKFRALYIRKYNKNNFKAPRWCKLRKGIVLVYKKEKI